MRPIRKALLARNNGQLLADGGGIIHMTTGAAEKIVNSTVNLSGIARADSATQVGGKIILGGANTGRVRIANKAQARGETSGGEIKVEADNVTMADNSVLNVRAFTNGDGGKINLLARNNAILNNRLRAMGGSNSGNGGEITTSAVNNLSFGNSLEVNAQAYNGGSSGSWIIDPINLNIIAATAGLFNTTLNTGTSIDASATNNLTLDSDIIWTSGANFSLTAGNDLILNGSINGNGDFNGNAGHNISLENGSSVTINDANIALESDSDIFVKNGASLNNLNGDMTLVSNNANGGNSAIEIDGNLSGDNTNISLTSDGYFTEINSTGSIFQTSGGTFAAYSDHGFDIDSGATLNLGSADVLIDAPDVRLGSDINTTGNLSGTATLVAVENNTAQIQDGVDIAKSGNATLVNIAAGTYNESVTIEKALILSGAGRDATIISAGLVNNGVTIDGDVGSFNRVYIRNLGFDGNLNGVDVKSTVNANEVLIGGSKFTNNADTGVLIRDGGATGGLNKFTMGYSEFANNGQKGVAVYGDTTSLSSIYFTKFLNNGMNSTSNGDGDILFYNHAGAVSLANVDVQGDTNGAADYGIQFLGGSSLPVSGGITLDNVSVAGQYRGSLIGIQQYGDLTLDMADVSLGGQTDALSNSFSGAGWGGSLFVSNVGATDIDLGNTEFKSHDQNYIVLGVDGNAPFFTDTDFDATGATFLGKLGSDMTLAENFAVEDKVSHTMDFSPLGLVTWNAGNVYVTQASENRLAGAIQRGVDASSIGGNVNVQDGTFIGDVNVNKEVNLLGAQAGIDARNRTGVDETIVLMQSPGFSVTADNVVIDGFEIMGGTSGDAGIIVDGADNVILANNKIHDISGGTDGDGIWIKNAKNGLVNQNWIYEINDDGLNARGFSSGLNVNNNLVENVRSTGLEAYRLLGTVSFTDNEINSAGRDGIRTHRADGSDILNNKINMDGVGNGIILSNINGVTVRDNEVNRASDGIVVEGGTGNVVDDNDIKDFLNTGVMVSGATDTNVTDNLIQYSFGTGVLVENSTGTVVGGIGNTLRNRIIDVGNAGVEVNGGSNTSVIGNDLRRTQTGVLADTAGSLNVYKNTIDNISTGVDISFSDGSKIVDNVITNASIGVFVEEGENVLIDDNDITNFNDAGIVVERTVNADVIDNFIQSTQKGTIGIDVLDGLGTQIGGDGNILRNRIYDVDNGVKLSGDTGTVIDGNDFRSTQTGVLATDTIDGGVRYTSNNLRITDNTFDGGYRAIDLDSARNVLIGGYRDGNSINDFWTGVKVVGGNNVNIDDNSINNVNYGIYADYVGQLNIEDNNLDARFRVGGKGTTGIYVGNSYNAQVGGYRDGNDVEDFETGIKIFNSTTADVEYNNVEEFKLNGIQVSNSRYIDVKNNDIRDGSGNGINVYYSDNAEINDNKIHDVSKDGILVEYGDNAVIKGNYIHRVGFDGIDVNDNDYVDINDNEVYSAGDNGIEVSDSFDATIQWNDVRNTDNDGINLEGSRIADIRNNYVENVGDDGIDVENTGTYFSFGVDINDNVINGANEDGINVYNTESVDVIGNTIKKAGRDGINVSWSNNADINANNVLGTNGGFYRNGTNGAGRDGINVENSSYVDIDGNLIQAGYNGFRSNGGKGAGRFGIYSDNTYDVDVLNNRVLGRLLGQQGSGTDAILVIDSAYSDIRSNKIFNVGGDAIHVKSSYAVDIADNQSLLTGDDGIDVEDSRHADIQGNKVVGTANNGIEVEYSDDANIDSNKVVGTLMNGIYVEGGDNIDVTNNEISFVKMNGIEVSNTFDALVNDNVVRNSGATGVLVNGAFGTEVSENRLIKNDIGVEVRGNGYRFIKLDDPSQDESESQQTAFISAPYDSESDQTLILNNTIDDSDTAGIKTSGNAVGFVEVTQNQLDRNAIGMLLEGGEIDISNRINPNTINGGETAMRIVGGDVSLTNDTLGATIFNNQSGNYVELVDGALFNPGTPTIIDGLAASWDGVVPLRDGLSSGVLTAVQRQAIENRIIDFDDNTTLGQIIVGLGFGLNQEDIFALNLFSLSPDAANVNVTFNGLPRTSAFNPNELASLEPAAGGDSAEDLANLEPAAGGSEGCWASVQDASFDGTVNFSFGSEAANVLSESACAN